ncbi:MAG: DUF2470 domain-containing protein [Myxococcales bacterium]|nr:DUF2470 domain-containing protein [Myxococcales bacterium]MCB9750979.1 DUF2470 domain-containing protein [Myxococcales bacterium]
MVEDAHATGGRSQELLYDAAVATPSHGEYARTLAARAGVGTLCTAHKGRAGHPYGSLCTYAMDGAAPVFLISELAEHTQNLRADPRASLLVAEPGEGDALARARVTLVGECRPLAGDARERARAAFLARHPGAAYYADFKDFHLWRLDVDDVRYIGGYGRMSWVDVDAWRGAEPDPLAGAAARIIAHMNEDHGDAMVLYCRHLSRATDTSAATMTGVDRYGFEMSALTGEGPRPIRLAFSRPVTSAAEVREELVELVQRVRAMAPA